MTTPSASTPSNGLRLPGLKSLAVAVGVTTLTATGAWAAQHAAQTEQGQAQQMQAGPSFERMQETMQQAREATDPAERRQLMRQHMAMMGEKMEAMRGMMGDMPMPGHMAGQASGDQSVGMSGDQSGQMQQMMGAAMPEMMTRMQEQQGMMQQMMEQMLEQQKMMMEMNEQQ